MLDFIGIIAITTTAIVVINALVSSLAIRAAVRLGVTAVLGAWIGLAVALGSTDELADAEQRAMPLVGLMFAAPLLLTAILAWTRPGIRKALLALPMPLLIGLNVTRIFGVLFVLLAAEGRLGGPFPYSAGWGDFATGVAALPVAWLALRAARQRDWVIGAWNAFGALDLVVAVALGIISAAGSPLQLIEAAGGSAAMQQLPWALVPTVLVPLFLIIHAVIFAQLRRRATSEGSTYASSVETAESYARP